MYTVTKESEILLLWSKVVISHFLEFFLFILPSPRFRIGCNHYQSSRVNSYSPHTRDGHTEDKILECISLNWDVFELRALVLWHHRNCLHWSLPLLLRFSICLWWNLVIEVDIGETYSSFSSIFLFRTFLRLSKTAFGRSAFLRAARAPAKTHL